jgi:hypothetical protein
MRYGVFGHDTGKLHEEGVVGAVFDDQERPGGNPERVAQRQSQSRASVVDAEDPSDG